ncbi:hypothetical protein OV14_2741 [Ensifer adhaerens OV14]|nr:hypothetical protein OV14_2741 [Ensifer adhaerens OV14]
MPKNGAWWLSELVAKVRVECSCGVKKQYDAKALLERIGDMPMPSLLDKLAQANGCSKTKNNFNDRCQLKYSDPMPSEAPPSRSYRLAMRSQLPEWYELFCHCKRCGRERHLDRHSLARRFGTTQSIMALGRRMRCKVCSNSNGNVIRVGKQRR